MRTHLFIVFFSSFFLFSLLMGCTKKARTGTKYPKNHTLYVNWGDEPSSLDWTLADDLISTNIIFNLMEPLVNIDFSRDDLPLQPGLFSTWKASEDFSIWKFTLRENVRWSDGTPLTTHHVVAAFERLLNPSTAARGADLLFEIIGAKDYNSGVSKDFSKVGIRVLAERTIEFQLLRPLSFFPKILTTAKTLPIRPDLIQKYQGQWTHPKNLITLGPYTLSEWKHEQYLVLKRNKSYFGKTPKIKNIYGYMIPNLSSALKLFESGKIDIQRGLTPQDEKRYIGKNELRIQPSLAVFYMNFNTRLFPFDNAFVRKAFVHAIDRKQVQRILGKYRRANNSWLPLGLLGAQETLGLKFDPKRSLNLLNKTHPEWRNSFKNIVLEGNTNETHRLLYENLQLQIFKNLGIRIEIKMQEWKSYLQKITVNPAPLFRLGFASLYPDPHFLMSLWTSNSNYNFTGWNSLEYDSLIRKAASEKLKQKRTQLYNQAQNILIEEAPFFTLYSATNLTLVSSRVQGLVTNSMERLLFKDISLKGTHESSPR